MQAIQLQKKRKPYRTIAANIDESLLQQFVSSIKDIREGRVRRVK